MGDEERTVSHSDFSDGDGLMEQKLIRVQPWPHRPVTVLLPQLSTQSGAVAHGRTGATASGRGHSHLWALRGHRAKIPAGGRQGYKSIERLDTVPPDV